MISKANLSTGVPRIADYKQSNTWIYSKKYLGWLCMTFRSVTFLWNQWDLLLIPANNISLVPTCTAFFIACSFRMFYFHSPVLDMLCLYVHFPVQLRRGKPVLSYIPFGPEHDRNAKHWGSKGFKYSRNRNLREKLESYSGLPE